MYRSQLMAVTFLTTLALGAGSAQAEPCTEAIAANAAATVGLLGCTPGPQVVVACPVAIVAKGLSMKAVIDQCPDRSDRVGDTNRGRNGDSPKAKGKKKSGSATSGASKAKPVVRKAKPKTQPVYEPGRFIRDF